ncbi:unnamed protein product, partial [Rotaria sp. Silwood1]
VPVPVERVVCQPVCVPVPQPVPQPCPIPPIPPLYINETL